MKYRIMLIVVVMFLLGGLNNARELNDLAIVSGLGIDLSEDGEYIITAQILNTKKENSSGSGTSSSSGSGEIVVYNSKNKSVQRALRNIIEESPRRLYLAHMELLLLSEKVAKQDILQSLDFFIRDNEGSNDFMVVITRGTTPQEVLEIQTPLESNPAQNIKDSILATNRYKGTSTNNTLSDNLRMILRESVPTVITSIELDDKEANDRVKADKKQNKGDEKQSKLESTSNTADEANGLETAGKESPESSTGASEGQNKTSGNSGTEQEQSIGNAEGGGQKKEEEAEGNKSSGTKNIKVSCYGFFKKNTLSGFLKNNDCLMRNIIENKVNSFTLQDGVDEDILVVEAISSKCIVTPKMEGDQYKVDMKIELACNITEIGKKIELKDEETVQKCADRISQKIKEEMQELIQRDKEQYKCDIALLGDVYYKHMYQEYEKMKAKYGEDYYQHIDADIDVKVSFPNEGGVMI